MFQLISPDKLVIGIKYGIVCRGDDYSGVYTGLVTDYYRPFLVFDKIYDNIEGFEYCSSFYFTKYDLYYEFISEFPRWNMERRSVNMIVRRLIGDDHFEW